MNAHSRVRVAGVLLLVGALSACGDGGTGAAPGDAGTDTGADRGSDGGRGYGLGGAGGENTAGSGGTAEDGAGTVAVAETDIGQILVDSASMTLYVFTDDSAGTSACEGACLDLWPPVSGEVEAGAGVREDLLGTLERSDGRIQASYADRPLYTFAQDTEPGDTTGHGFGGVWFVVDADGEPIGSAP